MPKDSTYNSHLSLALGVNMKIVEFLNRSLKSKELVELFEAYDVEVIYMYDRLYEGMSDRYFGKIAELGLEFSFDENQILKTIFIFTQQSEVYSQTNIGEFSLHAFPTKVDAINFAKGKYINYTEGNSKFLGEELDWVKLNLGQYSIHYQYSSGALSQVTLQVEKD